FIQTLNQAFFMSLFFLIAAYFVPSSLEKRGAMKFIKDRLFRLGVPTLIFMFMIFPAMEKMINPNLDLAEFYKNGILSLDFLTWTGPLWFAVTLLIFSIIYVPFNNLFVRLANKYSFTVTVKNVLGLVAVIAITAFSIRLVYPIGTSFVGFQLCFYAAYVFMFLMGIIAYRKNIIESTPYETAKKWFISSFLFGVPLWVLIVSFGVNKTDFPHSPIMGGWNIMAFATALWGSFVCVTMIVGLIGIFRRFLNTQNSLQKFLSTNAFAVYCFHPLVVVATSLLFKNITLQPIVRFIIVVLISVPLSFIFASLIRKVGFLRKLFA
ncbi:MAG: acyltransferase family protein, partial [Gammaproteobacteria bacterium]|nr:acyltransferase family protein [Gammaproteobacteria bacterium]